MQAEDVSLLLLEDEEEAQQDEEEADEGLNQAVKQPHCGGEEATAATYKLRRGQAEIKVRELRSKGLSFQIWPAAHALCWYLEDTFGQTGMLKTHLSHLPTCTIRSNMRVLELGAGTGIVGIVCAVLGAHCTITDLPHVIPNLEYNATLNQEAIESSDLGGSVVVRSLRWGERPDVEAIGGSFDLIVASDVVYYDHLFEPLLYTLKWLLHSPLCNMAACDAAPMTPPTAERTITNGVSKSSCTGLEEGAPNCIPTVKTLVTGSSSTPPKIGENATVLEEISLLSIHGNTTTNNGTYSAEEISREIPCTNSVPMPAPSSSIASIATMPMLKRSDDVAPIVLLAHLRRWKKDSHFFKKASKLFHVTVVHKHFHDANSRTGVTVYSFSRKEK